MTHSQIFILRFKSLKCAINLTGGLREDCSLRALILVALVLASFGCSPAPACPAIWVQNLARMVLSVLTADDASLLTVSTVFLALVVCWTEA
ncbi:hypothetical protein HDK77DRAFT_435782 [Phyllosticta capitalensis]|uniref:uncharacterized protein n=1 Tax=Phyllosticta capitalensis TaxID=121624 RepID=UPI003131F785